MNALNLRDFFDIQFVFFRGLLNEIA